MGNSCIRVDNSNKKLSNDNILIDWKANNETINIIGGKCVNGNMMM